MITRYRQGGRFIEDAEELAIQRLTLVGDNGLRKSLLVDVGIVRRMRRNMDGTTMLYPPNHAFYIIVEELPETINDRFMAFFTMEQEGRC